MPLAIRIALLSLLPTAALLAISFWLATGVVSEESRARAQAVAEERARQLALHWKQEGRQLTREAVQTANTPAVEALVAPSAGEPKPGSRWQKRKWAEPAPALIDSPAGNRTVLVVENKEGRIVGSVQERDGVWKELASLKPATVVRLDGIWYRFATAPITLDDGTDAGRVWFGQAVPNDGFELAQGKPGRAHQGFVEAALDDGWLVRVPASAGASVETVRLGLAKVFGGAALCSGVLALIVAWLVSRSVVSPLAKLADTLRRIERTGVLTHQFDDHSKTAEVQALAQTFNRAASSVIESRKRLEFAYRAFVETMAHALDARDLYTAGHSRRVSDYSCAIADTMRLSDEQTEVIRMGALLHDIGKIGVPDHILQKPDSLTFEEFEILKQHVTIGKRILESCDGFQAYLPIVELHHENHDGTGYPWRISGKEIPIEARIVHVADAYDAMTTDRPYRKGLPHETALERLRQLAGAQFDPEVVAAVDRMVADGWRGVEHSSSLSPSPSVFALARAIEGRQSADPVRESHGVGRSGP